MFTCNGRGNQPVLAARSDASVIEELLGSVRCRARSAQARSVPSAATIPYGFTASVAVFG